MSINFGITDIGSNTIRLNVYSVSRSEFDVTFTSVMPAGLVSYIHNHKMAPEGTDKLIEVIRQFLGILKGMNITQYAFFATACLRNIKNSDEVLERVRKETGVEIDLLSGSQEGRLSFNGAVHFFAKDDGLYMDTGGGSTELVLFNDRKILSVESMPIGSLNLYNHYVKEVLPTPEEARKLEKAIRLELQKVFPDRHEAATEFLAVTGGSMRAAREIMVQLKWIHPDQFRFPASLVNDLFDWIIEDDIRAIRMILRVHPDRLHTLTCGLMIVRECARYTRASTIEVSQNGLREGYLIERVIEPSLSQEEYSDLKSDSLEEENF